MFDANVTAGADVIESNIPGTGVHTIAPTSALPKITDPVSINGYSQPGAKANTRAVGSDAVLNIELSGAGAPPGIDGLWVAAPGNTIGGTTASARNVISGNTYGIGLGGAATNSKVSGNYIGTLDTEEASGKLIAQWKAGAGPR